MFKQIFDKGNGNPKLIEQITDEETGELIYDYDREEYTDETPPSELYQPIHYRDGEWHGLTREQWLAQQPEPDPIEPTGQQVESGMMQVELFKTQMELQELREENANIIAEIVALKGGQ